MYPRISFDASFQRLPNSVFRFTANSLEIFEDTKWECEGAHIGNGLKVTEEAIWKLPEESNKAELKSHILSCWYDDCKQVFVKPLNLETLQEKITHKVEEDYPIIALSPEEENDEWVLLWTVVKLDLSKNSVVFYWAPTHKRSLVSRINEEFETACNIEVQGTEDSQYRVIESANLQPANSSWVLDVAQLPLSDRPALRLEAEFDQARERFRRRIRDARLRAKLSRYRADRLATQFQEKYGIYPVEDTDEAQTEYEESSGED